MKKTFFENVIGGVVTGVIVAALIGLYSLYRQTSLYHLLLTDHLVWDWQGNGTAVAQVKDTDPTHHPEVDLGKHDICILTNVSIQKNSNGHGQCSLVQKSEHVWWVNATVDQDGNVGQQALCGATCADFK